MSSELLALVSAFCFASAFVTGKRGLDGNSLVTSLVITMGCAWVVLVAITLADPPTEASWEGVAWFVATGLVAPGIGYSAALAGVDRLGPATSVPIQQGGRPLISAAGAVVLLGESLTPLELMGVAAIITGGIGLSLREAEVLEGAVAESGRRATRGNRFRGFHPGVAFPIVAALAFAAFDIMVKQGLRTMADPTFAAMVAVGAGFWGWLLLAVLVPRSRRELCFGDNVEWLIGGGVLFGFAQLTVFQALLHGRVVLVGPLLASQPLMVLLLSRLLLRELEVIRPVTVALTVLVLSGTTLVAL